jgi:4-diphosphocytidyl-2-C-methyl-D-erythritol kinase
LDAIAGELRSAAGGGASPLEYLELLVNDLGHAALSLRPEILGALRALEDAGARAALVTGSGPTAFGLFDDIVLADRAARALPPRYAGAIVTAPERSA